MQPQTPPTQPPSAVLFGKTQATQNPVLDWLRSLTPNPTCSPCAVNCNQGRNCPLHTARATPAPTAPTPPPPPPVQTSAQRRLLPFRVRVRHRNVTHVATVLAASAFEASAMGQRQALAQLGYTSATAPDARLTTSVQCIGRDLATAWGIDLDADDAKSEEPTHA